MGEIVAFMGNMIRFNFHQILAIAEALMKRVAEGRNIGKCNDDTSNCGGVDNNNIGDGMISDAKRDLCSLLMFHYSQSNDTITNIVQSVVPIKIDDEQKKKDGDDDGSPNNGNNGNNGDDNDTNRDTNNNTTITDNNNNIVEWDRFLPPTAAMLLAADIPLPAASVMLTRLPSIMPLLVLSANERVLALNDLHARLYLLACYHIPLLVLHIDRHVPGWHLPSIEVVSESESTTQRRRDDFSSGAIPPTWFVSGLAGECLPVLTSDCEENESTALAVVETTTITLGVSTMAIENNLALWDVLLTSRRGKSKEETSPVAVDDEQDDHDASLIFFLALAVLKKNSDTLLMLQGLELAKVMTFQTAETETEVFVHGTADSGGCDDNDNCEIQEGGVYVQNWRAIALCMRETTPASVVEGLQSAEDEAFEQALEMRQRSMLLKMEKRLTIEAEEHMCAVEAERQRKEEVANYEMYKTRLEKFYTKYCPEKSGSEDRILKTYEGRLELLDQRLKKSTERGLDLSYRR